MACKVSVVWRYIDQANIEGTGTCTGACAEAGHECKGKWLKTLPAGSGGPENVEMLVTDNTALFTATANPVACSAVFQCLCGTKPEDQSETPLGLKYTRPLIADIASLGILALKDLLSK
jgi:hypothetical protein